MHRVRRFTRPLRLLPTLALALSAAACGGGGSSTTAPVPTALSAGFDGQVRIGQAPLVVAFADRSQGNVASWLWEFGDGSTSTDASPTHTYTEAGLYDVALTVSNGLNSDTLTRPGLVAVEVFPAPGSDAGDRGLAAHALRRMANGPTAAELDEVTDMGVAAYVEAQLEPLDVPESATLEALLDMWQRPLDIVPGGPDYDDFERATIARHVYSRRQLLEQLTLFWNNHFNTNFANAVVYFGSMEAATYLEWREDRLFQKRALGSFEKLLLASATSPAMIGYLHSFLNEKSAPNENYARELLELHTMGVGNGYTERDIEAVARCFTGWGFCRVAAADELDPHAPCVASEDGTLWAFHFSPELHDEGEKTIFAGTDYELFLPARGGPDGVLDGYELITHLATLPQTAQFISTKLIQKFVDDDAPQDLVDRCVAKWIATRGDMRAVMRTILHSEHFRAPGTRWNKLRTPIEALSAHLRGSGATIAGEQGFDALRSTLHGSLNQRIYYWLSPDGYPESWREQFGTTKLLHFVLGLQASHTLNFGIAFDLSALLAEHGVAADSAEEIVDFFFDVFLGDNFLPADRERALTFLTTDDLGAPAALDPAAADFEARLGKLVSFVGSFPQNLLQ